MGKWDVLSGKLDFLDEGSKKDDQQTADSKSKHKRFIYKVLVADDDQDVHDVTALILKDFTFEGHRIEIHDTYSGAETVKFLEDNEDIAVLFLDVVMETNHSGLDVVKAIRDIQKNRAVRIVLRTGQPGEAPEESVIRDYDINDYRLKTDLTARRLKTTMYSALRNYRDILRLERHQKGLEKIIKSSAKLFEHNSLNDFLISILTELSNFQIDQSDMLFIRESEKIPGAGLVTIEEKNRNKIVAATGRFERLVGEDIEGVAELNELTNWINTSIRSDTFIHKLEYGFIIESRGKSKLKNFIYVEGPKDSFDYDLINLFLSNFAIALDNYILNNMINSTQREIIFALGETVESHFEEVGSHIRRISEMMYRFAICAHQSYSESEMLKLASTMHDLGKVAIPDAILKKPGRLTEEEFHTMKAHANYGYRILCKSELPVMKLAAEIALNHHEKFDGTGYPQGLMGMAIPLSARMMAITDVFDAMTHKRCYKEAASVEETLAMMIDQKDKHFDGRLLQLFIDNVDTITEGM